MQKKQTCPVCASRSHFLDSLNGSRSCEAARGLVLPEADWSLSYYLCEHCSFCFAADCAQWSREDFKTRIYNADYALVDPDFSESRPKGNRAWLLSMLSGQADFEHLDYGGGEGQLSAMLKSDGWRSSSFDPFFDAANVLPSGKQFQLVTAFEVFEHTADPQALIAGLKSLLDTEGVIVFSTLLSDGHIACGRKLDWWYGAPRNGHISLFSSMSLRLLAKKHGLSFASFSPGMHSLWISKPVWAAHWHTSTTPIVPTMEKFDTEEAVLRARVQSNPKEHASWHALGLHAFNVGNLSLAIQCLEAAIAYNGKVALYPRNLGEMYRRAGLLEKSIHTGRSACKLAPLNLDAHYNLGLAYTDAKDYTQAIASYRKALKLNPQHGLSWNNLGSAQEQLGDKDAALAAYEKAIALNTQHAEAQNNAGAIYCEQGRLAEARACFQAAITARADFVESHYNLSSLKKYTRDDPHLALLESVYGRRTQLSDHARIRYDFAFGKALDDLGEYDRAFTAYDEGNRLQHALLPMNETVADYLLERIMAVFNADFFAERRHWHGAVDTQRTPVFIVGMPRSGTTLLEQILCSHASVHGAGELLDLNETIKQATQAGEGKPFTEGIQILDEAAMRRIGDDYLNRVWRLSPSSAYITDKMPANFFYLGLIHLALPHAKIIHAMRDPMDSCFSCFSRLFNDTMEFAYDLGTLGRYYVRYRTLMQHWRAVLPEGTILDLPYEDMVANTETQARHILKFVGLPWDENCLKFHENTRLVKTASVAQVRQPIYKSSVARWKHFARHLRPLYELVKDYRPGDDANSLFLSEHSADPTPTPFHSAEVAHLQGIASYRAGRFDEALAYYQQALDAQPDFPAALNSKGFVLQDMNRMGEALVCFERAVEISPEFSMARLNLGMAQLKQGDWAQGWENYEARWSGSAEASNGSLNRPACPLPQWDGKGNTKKKRLLVITEQGFGDTFQFARYLSLAAERFAKVGFVCSQPTLRVMEWALSEDIVTFTRMPVDYAAWDLQCPLLSMPRAFATKPDSIPQSLPYLQVPPRASAHWRERLDLAAPGGLRVGIAWAGRKAHQYDARRSLRFEQILPLLHTEPVTWVCLQKWAPEDQRPNIPDSIAWLDWTEELSDFADSAALIVNLDLVISIDSALVHLAGGLNRPVWMLNRFDSEWRWFSQRADSPWYPTLRIFNQPAFGDWASVLDAAQQALAALPSPRKGRRKSLAKALPKSAASEVQTVFDPLPGVSIEQGMQLASQHQSAGRLAEAEQLLRKILQIQPQHAHALHLLGVVAYQAGKPDLALQLIAKAVEIDGQVALFHSNLAEMHRQQGHLDQAIAHGEQAVAIDASMACAHSNLGIAYYDRKAYDRAQACHRKALALQPPFLQSLNNLGSIARARKDMKGAADWYRKALAINGDFLEALSNLGAVLVEDEQAEAALPWLERALQLQPNYPEALCNLGLVRLKQEQAELAEALLRRSLQLRPGYPEAMVGLSRVLYDQNRLAEARAVLRDVVAHTPDKADAWSQLGMLASEMDSAEEAEAAYRQALVLDPKMTDALTGLGNLRLEQGKIAAAEEFLREALVIDPDHLGARFHLTQTRKVKAGDDNLKALIAKLPEAQTYSAEKQISLHYALGKSFDDLQEWDKAFLHFMEGARLKRAKLNYDAEADSTRTRRIAEVMGSSFMDALRGAGDPSHVPVFVLGMPRSGTTLTEQILASHPDVHGAGELRDLMEVVQQPVPSQLFEPFPENLARLTPDRLTEWGNEYVRRLRERAPEAKRITDKMPANYLALGLIPLMLPNAKIVHVKRNPVDTCVSCFTRLFNRQQEATYDLAELGRHYANYARLTEHWRQALPKESFLEVQYEDIVADMEGQARRLIDWCGLEWSSSCLAFHENKRSIRTASVTQVRQPIYNSSVERWRHYEPFLEPLFAGLGEFAPAK